MKSRWLWLWWLLMWPFLVQAQNFRAFSEDPDVMLSEIPALLANDRNASKADLKRAEAVLEQFGLLYNNLLDSERQDIFHLCQTAAQAKIRPFPDFLNLLEALNGFFENGQSAQSFKAFTQCLTQLSKQRKMRDVNTLCEAALNLFQNNSLHESLAARWYVDHADFQFFEKPKPRFSFSKVNIRGYGNNDSTRIHLSSGHYMPLDLQWLGFGGLVDYQRAGFDLSEMFIQLNNYTLNLKNTRFTADSVNFFNKIYFKVPLMGSMEEKLQAPDKPEKASYPNFKSYDNTQVINDIFPGVDFQGQYTQAGHRVKCGNPDERAILRFSQQQKPILEVYANNFIFSRDKIAAPNAQAIFRLGEDSIIHPNCDIKFDGPKREISILHPFNASFTMPLQSSFHQVDIRVEALYWPIDSSQVVLSMLRAPGRQAFASFESSKYFSNQRFLSIMDRIDYNPLSILRQASEKRQSRILFLEDLVSAFGMDIYQLKIMFLRLSSFGYLTYYAHNESIRLHNKLFQDLLASAQRFDYDCIEIISDCTDQPHAYLDLKDYKMTIFGVSELHLSTTQNVYIRPSDSIVVLGKACSLDFDALVHGGKFDFFAKGCHFDYEQFKITLNNVESLDFSVNGPLVDDFGNRELKKVATSIRHLNGEMLIDYPDNKSGRQVNPDYPIFISNTESYVYYNDPSIRGGIYDSTRFFYTIYPFRLERLNHFTTDSLNFEGELHSGGIFPVIEKPLVVMSDYSLGLQTISGDQGLPLYQDKGHYYDSIRLDRSGLTGKGKIQYQTSSSMSNHIVFMLDSMRAKVREYQVGAQHMSEQQYSETYAQVVDQLWLPYQNRYQSRQLDSGFSIFQDRARFFGEMTLSDKNMIGNGYIRFKDGSILSSDSIVLRAENLEAAKADLSIMSPDQSGVAIRVENYQARIDMTQSEGHFRSNGEHTFIVFPSNAYICYMDQLLWKIDERTVDMTSTHGSSTADAKLDQLSHSQLLETELPGSLFLAVSKKLDSLSFLANHAQYLLDQKMIVAGGVRQFFVADISVMLSDRRLEIGHKGVMSPIKDANILMDAEHLFHEVQKADLTILSGTQYKASGYYQYTNAEGQQYAVYFDQISPGKNGISTAQAMIDEDNEFRLSPAFDYSGKIVLEANKPGPYFNGSTLISHACSAEDQRQWANFEAEIRPDSLFIPLGQPIRSKSKQYLAAGFFFNPQLQLRPVFLEPIKSTERPILAETGTLSFDQESHSYFIENAASNGYIGLDAEQCQLFGIGDLDLQVNLGRVLLDPYGELNYAFKEDLLTAQVVLPIDFFLDDKSVNTIQSILEKSDGQGLSLQSERFIHFVESRLDKRDAERLINEVNLYGFYRRIPNSFNQLFLLGDVTLNWNPESNSFISSGPIGVAQVGQTKINKYVDGLLQISKNRRGDVLNLYLEVSPEKWFFFSYSDGVMQVLSSQESFNDNVMSLKSSKRKSNSGPGRGSYEFTISSERKMNDVIRKILEAQGIDPDQSNEMEEEYMDEDDYEDDYEADEDLNNKVE